MVFVNVFLYMYIHGGGGLVQWIAPQTTDRGVHGSRPKPVPQNSEQYA